MKEFSQRSKEKLIGVHPLLCKCAQMALERSRIDFGISEGLRTIERQKELVEAKKSQTMHSYHLEGKAVDVFAVIDGKTNWDLHNYALINEAFQDAARELEIKITWGGSWKTLKDGPHFQIEV